MNIKDARCQSKCPKKTIQPKGLFRGADSGTLLHDSSIPRCDLKTINLYFYCLCMDVSIHFAWWEVKLVKRNGKIILVVVTFGFEPSFLMMLEYNPGKALPRVRGEWMFVSRPLIGQLQMVQCSHWLILISCLSLPKEGSNFQK